MLLGKASLLKMDKIENISGHTGCNVNFGYLDFRARFEVYFIPS